MLAQDIESEWEAVAETFQIHAPIPMPCSESSQMLPQPKSRQPTTNWPKNIIQTRILRCRRKWQLHTSKPFRRHMKFLATQRSARHLTPVSHLLGLHSQRHGQRRLRRLHQPQLQPQALHRDRLLAQREAVMAGGGRERTVLEREQRPPASHRRLCWIRMMKRLPARRSGRLMRPHAWSINVGDRIGQCRRLSACSSRHRQRHRANARLKQALQLHLRSQVMRAVCDYL
mmetsp:Transcript_492/g.1023  ORF Transcript_492/g.1023 Transcript_492/m.1023 type:complete len:229 (+) Transcript_492:1-687(+)